MALDNDDCRAALHRAAHGRTGHRASSQEEGAAGPLESAVRAAGGRAGGSDPAHRLLRRRRADPQEAARGVPPRERSRRGGTSSRNLPERPAQDLRREAQDHPAPAGETGHLIVRRFTCGVGRFAQARIRTSSRA